MNMRLLSAAVLLLSAAGADAHHSFAAEFDGNKPVRLTGTLTKIEWTNPHTYFHLDVRDSKGNVSSWTCEASNPAALSRQGWKKGDVKFGDALVVDGYLARDGSQFIDARRIRLPDGRSLFTGSAGDGGPSSTSAKQ
jgi:hypothetical protein